MAHCAKLRLLLAAFFLMVFLSPTYLHAGEAIEKAGVTTGVTVGNMIR